MPFSDQQRNEARSRLERCAFCLLPRLFESRSSGSPDEAVLACNKIAYDVHVGDLPTKNCSVYTFSFFQCKNIELAVALFDNLGSDEAGKSAYDVYLARHGYE